MGDSDDAADSRASAGTVVIATERRSGDGGVGVGAITRETNAGRTVIEGVAEGTGEETEERLSWDADVRAETSAVPVAGRVNRGAASSCGTTERITGAAVVETRSTGGGGWGAARRHSACGTDGRPGAGTSGVSVRSTVRAAAAAAVAVPAADNFAAGRTGVNAARGTLLVPETADAPDTDIADGDMTARNDKPGAFGVAGTRPSVGNPDGDDTGAGIAGNVSSGTKRSVRCAVAR